MLKDEKFESAVYHFFVIIAAISLVTTKIKHTQSDNSQLCLLLLTTSRFNVPTADKTRQNNILRCNEV